MKQIGIVAHSAEGGALCFLTACREGIHRLGSYMHPTIIVSAIPMGLSMPYWESGEHGLIGNHLSDGVKQVAAAGADFFVCPDNTAHIVLEDCIGELPIPGLHIADVVCEAILMGGWKKVGLLGTKWTMTGPVYESALERCGLERIIPSPETRAILNTAIFEELCQGIFMESTADTFIQAINDLKAMGAECVILGCTEIPLIINEQNSPLPILDSTRLLAQFAVSEAISSNPLSKSKGWLTPV